MKIDDLRHSGHPGTVRHAYTEKPTASNPTDPIVATCSPTVNSPNRTTTLA
jgi:hypothetical protein